VTADKMAIKFQCIYVAFVACVISVIILIKLSIVKMCWKPLRQ